MIKHDLAKIRKSGAEPKGYTPRKPLSDILARHHQGQAIQATEDDNQVLASITNADCVVHSAAQ
jgi:hypothetical protein